MLQFLPEVATLKAGPALQGHTQGSPRGESSFRNQVRPEQGEQAGFCVVSCTLRVKEDPSYEKPPPPPPNNPRHHPTAADTWHVKSLRPDRRHEIKRQRDPVHQERRDGSCCHTARRKDPGPGASVSIHYKSQLCGSRSAPPSTRNAARPVAASQNLLCIGPSGRQRPPPAGHSRKATGPGAAAAGAGGAEDAVHLPGPRPPSGPAPPASPRALTWLAALHRRHLAFPAPPAPLRPRRRLLLAPPPLAPSPRPPGVRRLPTT